MRLKALAVIAFLITYGSLYPFDFAMPAHFEDRVLQPFLTDYRLWTSRGDVLGNIGLFVPFGMAGIWWLDARTSRAGALISTFVAGVLLAAALQVLQLYVTSRSALLADIVWNTVGLGIGLGAGLVLSADWIAAHIDVRTVSPAALTLIAVWVVAELAPLVPTLDLQGIKSSIKQIVLTPSLRPAAAAYGAAQVLLLSRLVFSVLGPRRAGAVTAALIIAALIGKLFVVDLRLDWTSTAALAGGGLAWYAWSNGGTTPLPARAVAFLLVAAYSVRALEPFVLRDPAPFSWVPFAASLTGAMLPNLRALSAAGFALGGTLWLLRDERHTGIVTPVVLFCWVLVLEVAQRWIVGRQPDSTEPVLVLLAGWLLWHVEAGVHRDARTTRA